LSKPSRSRQRADAPTDADSRVLRSLDEIVLGLIVAILILAPLMGGAFANSPLGGMQSFGPLVLLEFVGIPLVYVEPLGLPLLALLTGGALALLLAREWDRPVAVGAVRGLEFAAAGLGIWAALSLTRTPLLHAGWNTLTALVMALLMGGMVARLARDRHALNLLLSTLVASGGIAAAVAIHEYLTKLREGIPFHRTFGTFINPDFLAGYLLLLLPLTLAAFAAATKREARLAFGVASLLQSAAILLTGSRSGAAIAVVALLFWAALSFWARAVSGMGLRVGAALGVFALGAALASTPTLSRVVSKPTAQSAPAATFANVEAAVAGQSHSGAFRRYTWTGTFRMAKANPLLGTGLGSFEVANARYAETAFTAHAHNTYLQLAGEIGLPGLLFFLTAIAAAVSFALHVLALGRHSAHRDEGAAETRQTERFSLFRSPRLMLTGLMAGILASLLHNVIDSDGYILVIAITFCVVVALLAAQARDLAPFATQTPRPLPKLWSGAGALLVLLLLWRGGAGASARIQNVNGLLALNNREATRALAAYRAATAADPLDPEPYLQRAMILQATLRSEGAGDSADVAEKELQNAVRVAPIGKTYYRLGQYYVRQGERYSALNETARATEALQSAAAAFEQARQREPRNVQNLRALADTLSRSNQKTQAAAVYREITALEKTPYGTVRAMPEMVETEFGIAHRSLGDLAFEAQNWSDAAQEYAAAATVFREFWQKRTFTMNLAQAQQNPEKYQRVLQQYDHVLTRWQESLTRQNPHNAAEVARIAQEQSAFRAERDKEAAEQAKQTLSP
jgi:O-antigen ligase/tetratricopeptide (TPR) repeat protein